MSPELRNFVADNDTYEELLDVFEGVGKELRDEIDKKFAEFRKWMEILTANAWIAFGRLREAKNV